MPDNTLVISLLFINPAPNKETPSKEEVFVIVQFGSPNRI